MAAALGGGVPPGAGGGGGGAPAAHLSDQLEEVGVAFLQADEVKKACEEFALKMKESTMAEMIRHYRKGLNTLIVEIGAGGYPEATMTEIYQNSHYVEQVRETIVHTLMLERACDEMKDGSLHQSKLSEVQDQGSVVSKFEAAVMDHPHSH